jgi:Concanavalin A-like lectin/glucanases superfamily
MDGSSTPDRSPRTYLMFDGIDNCVEVGSSPLFSVATTGALTVSVWMMPQVLTFSHSVKGYVHWLGKGTGSGNSGQQEWTLRMYNLANDANRPNRISFYVFNPEGHLGIGSYYEDSNDPVVAGQWMHFTGVADNGAITIYKNGIDTGHCFQYQGDGTCRQQFDAAGNRIVIDPVAGSAPLRIGTQDGESYFQGGIAALRIWSRPLTNTEVGDLYQSDQVPLDGLVAQYLLNEGSGTVAFDTSGGNNNGTIYGATWTTM